MRSEIKDLNTIPFPARELFDNDLYKRYYIKHFGYTMTSMISSRGCPFTCDFCSKPVFGDTFRQRSPKNIVDEMQTIEYQRYDTIWFADDCFTLHKDRVMDICYEIISRGLKIKWQCLSRADTLDHEMAKYMREAGCQMVYFGLESGNNEILKKIMNKNIKVQTARNAVCTAKNAGLKTGAFFIIGYPEEKNETILNTIDFAISLPLDYASFTLPYPIPGTGLYKKVKKTLQNKKNARIKFIDQSLEFQYEFSEFKLKFAIIKAAIQFRIKKYFGDTGDKIFGKPFKLITDKIFKALL
jgi:anaerobic magnesium-protoporphyrin IX monomethyl ester cyclase